MVPRVLPSHVWCRRLGLSSEVLLVLSSGVLPFAGDPITHLQYTSAAHAHAARRLCALADRHCQGRLLAMGGGGYNRDNLARAWTAVLSELVDTGQ